jgi:UDP-glucose 4,6-dehydratase
VNLDRLDYCSCLENLDEIKYNKNYKFVKGNICSSELVNYVLKEEEIDTIMHFAAQTHVDNSFGNSFSFTQNNILGTHVLLESAKIHGIKRFIHVSTDEVYGEGAEDQEPMFEDQVLEVRRKRETGRQKERERQKCVHALSACQLRTGPLCHVDS